MRAPVGLSLVAVAVVATSTAAAGSPVRGSSTLVASMPGHVRALAAAPGRIAWIDGQWRLHVLRLATGQRTTIVYTQKRFVNRQDPFSVAPQVAFAGSRPVWGDARGTPEVLQSVYSTGATGRLRPVVRLRHYDAGTGGAGGYLLSIAGARSGGAYSWGHEVVVGHGGRTTGGGVWTVADGVSRRVPNLPPALALARSGARLALAPVKADGNSISMPEPPTIPTVEIATVEGKVLASFTAKYDVQALALTPRYVFVDVANENGVGGTEIRDATTGKLTRWLPGRQSPQWSASGRYAVYSTCDSVWLLDGATGAVRRVARAGCPRSVIVQAAIVGRTIWWAEATATPGSHGDAENPADFVSTIHERVLPP